MKQLPFKESQVLASKLFFEKLSFPRLFPPVCGLHRSLGRNLNASVTMFFIHDSVIQNAEMKRNRLTAASTLLSNRLRFFIT